MNSGLRFKNRKDAGRQLAGKLEQYKSKDVIVLALPRGGVVVAAEIARVLHAPLDLIITRKIGHPTSPEYAIGAVNESGGIVMNERELKHVDAQWLDNAVKKEKAEIQRRRSMYTQHKKSVHIQGKIAIVVDDGIATGLTMKVALMGVKHMLPQKIIAAIPITSSDTAEEIKTYCDELIALYKDPFFKGSVGLYYKEFDQVDDKTVIALIKNQV